VGGDEDDRDLLPPPRQFSLKIGPRHPGHRDVQEEALGFADEVRREERIRG
jgi:hypothetical protein